MLPIRFVFDLDDTLYKERNYAVSALQYAGNLLEMLYQVQGATEALLGGFAEGETNVIGEYCRSVGISESARDQVLAAMRGHMPSISMDSAAAAFVNALRASHSAFGILTDGRSITQRAKIHALGLLDAAHLGISEEAGFSKPDPRCYQQFERVFGSATYVYVGDNPRKDFVAANALGWVTVMVASDGTNIHDQTLPDDPCFHPNHIINSFDQLNALLL
jgi:putative hydrolase of the HAD superfamily